MYSDENRNQINGEGDTSSVISENENLDPECEEEPTEDEVEEDTEDEVDDDGNGGIVPLAWTELPTSVLG